MRQDWVLDVLTDLKSFAQQNGMFTLAEHLDDTLIVAAAEIAAHGGFDDGVDRGLNARGADQHIAAGKHSQ